MVEPSDVVGRVVVEKRFELYARAGAQLLELDELTAGPGGDDDLRRARLLLADLARLLRGNLALLTPDVTRELTRAEELAGRLEGDPAELRERLQVLHVHLARMLRSPQLEELEEVLGLAPRLRQRLELERRDLDALARSRALEEQCLRHEAEARDLVASQQYSRAARCLRRGLSLDPERAVFHNDLGVVLSLMGQTPEAVDAYRHAVALNERRSERRTEEWTTTYYNLAVALRKWAADALQRGERDLARERLSEARAALTQYVGVARSGPKVDEARRALDQITGQILSIEAPAEAT